MPPNNPLSLWGNEKTMNLNTLVLTNIQSSPYFKVKLFELKTYHEVIDEIYYKVSHLEPWEKGSRKTAGQTGMCGGVRGVGAGGIVSSAYCLLYKLFTLKLTKKQVIGLINHMDSPYIRGLGFMYIRYTQPPADLWAWFEDYLDDDEEIDVKAGEGHVMTIGEMLRQWLVKLEWYSTLFPRIPVPIQKDIAMKLKDRPITYNEPEELEPQHIPDDQVSFGEAERRRGYQENNYGNNYRRDDRGESYGGREAVREDNYRNGDYSRDKDCYRSSEPSRDRDNRGRSPGNQRSSRQTSPYERSSVSRRSPPRYANSFERELARERDRQQREQGRDKRRSRSRSPRDRNERRSRSMEHRERRSGSQDRRERKSPSRKEKRSRSRDRKEKRSRSRDRKEKRSRSRDRKEKRSRSRDRKEKRSRSRERKEKKRSGSRDRDYERHNSSSHKHSHKEKKDKHRDEDRREGKSHKHKHRDREH
ncbi:uncharacterized protein LOC143289896 [Babylonia areolata]|uniref:uncharacterized protein LOC143289896 n=1 Tax=Babylonia areolata TaxID=304850 RepID=UPI003FD669EE